MNKEERPPRDPEETRRGKCGTQKKTNDSIRPSAFCIEFFVSFSCPFVGGLRYPTVMKPRDLLKLGFKQGPRSASRSTLSPRRSASGGARARNGACRASRRSQRIRGPSPPCPDRASADRADREAGDVCRAEATGAVPDLGRRARGGGAGSDEQRRAAARRGRGALMPDAHQGYGLPIGGVLATENAVIPVRGRRRYRLPHAAVGVRHSRLGSEAAQRAARPHPARARRSSAPASNFKSRSQHDVLDEDWNVTPVVAQVFDKARGQLGTSGSGNHFVEFGILTLDKPDLGLEAGAISRAA